MFSHPGPGLVYLLRVPNDDLQSYRGDGHWLKVCGVASQSSALQQCAAMVHADRWIQVAYAGISIPDNQMWGYCSDDKVRLLGYQPPGPRFGPVRRGLDSMNK